MLSDPAPSPPVPTTSSSGVSSMGGRTARCLSAEAAPESSSGASPLTRSAIRKAAICGGGHSCSTIVPMAVAISSCERLSRRATFPRTSVTIELSLRRKNKKPAELLLAGHRTRCAGGTIQARLLPGGPIWSRHHHQPAATAAAGTALILWAAKDTSALLIEVLPLYVSNAAGVNRVPRRGNLGSKRGLIR